jgi:hypothetical protein
MSYLLDQRARWNKSIEEMDKAYKVPGHDRDPSIQKKFEAQTKDISSKDQDKYMGERIDKFDKEYQMKKYNLRE